MKHKIKGWIARDSDGRLLFYTDKPWKCTKTKSWGVSEGEWMELDKTWYPNVKWEDKEPTKAEVGVDDMCIDETGNTVDNRTYCKEHCKGYQESGGKCFFDDDCEEKKKATNARLPKFKVGDRFLWHIDNSEFEVLNIEVKENYIEYECERVSNPHEIYYFYSCEEDGMLPKPEKEQTIEISSTKEAEEIINFIKDCFNMVRYKLPGADWPRYEAALEVLRPEYKSYQQGFNAGYEKGYEARKRVEKELAGQIKDFLNDIEAAKNGISR